MDSNNLTIICYTGGTCGDLITALVDPTGIIPKPPALTHDSSRIKLKKPHLFSNNEEKDVYLNNINCLSIPSHDLAYHIDRKHDFIGIRVQDPDVALWAATRFKQLHRPNVWEEMTKFCGASTVEKYAQILIDFGNLIAEHTDKIIMLEDIVSGNVLTKLEKFVKLDDQAGEVYQQWLKVNKCPVAQS